MSCDWGVNNANACALWAASIIIVSGVYKYAKWPHGCIFVVCVMDVYYLIICSWLKGVREKNLDWDGVMILISLNFEPRCAISQYPLCLKMTRGLHCNLEKELRALNG